MKNHTESIPILQIFFLAFSIKYDIFCFFFVLTYFETYYVIEKIQFNIILIDLVNFNRILKMIYRPSSPIDLSK